MRHKPYERYCKQVYCKWLLIYDGSGYDDEKGTFHYDGTGKEYGPNGQLIYEGEYKYDFRYGAGREYRDGQLIYEGKYICDFRYGAGREYRPDGTLLYEGKFLTGKWHGQGKQYREDGTLEYEGEFQKGMRHGQGRLYYENGALKYEGEFVKGKAHGQGKHYQKDGTLKYEGEFQAGKRHGQGKQYREDGTLLYEGEFLDNLPCGQGRRYYENGALLYEGQFQVGKWHGQGKLYEKDGTLRYEGGFEAGKKQGQGKEYYPSGPLHYEGGFLLGKWHGRGKTYDLSGTLHYEGEFLVGSVHGQGKLYKKDGTLEFEGMFKHGYPAPEDGQKDGKPSGASQGKTDKKDKPRQKAPPPKSSALDELHKLIGLDSLKREINKHINLYKVNQRRKAQGMQVPAVSMHMVFTGNPGTGKTTVARLIARIYHEIGLLPQERVVEVKRDGLVAAYIGQTAIKTREVIESALGGVLFIDEAYTLKPEGDSDPYGQEAVDTLLAEMENNRENLVVIVAGYDKEMQRFIDSNPGLKSRFATFLHFDDYDAEQLLRIFHEMVHSKGFHIEKDAEPLLSRYFERICRTRGSDFGNAREARALFEAVYMHNGNRLAEDLSSDITAFTKEDIQSAVDEKLGKADSDKPSVLDRLNALTGLSGVKEEVRKLREMVAFQQRYPDMNLDPPSMHMVFSGNPGTASPGTSTLRTTAARS